MNIAEKILRAEILDIVEFGENGNNTIKYNDALRAVEKALNQGQTLPIDNIIYCSCSIPIRGEDRTNGYSCQYCLKKIKEL